MIVEILISIFFVVISFVIGLNVGFRMKYKKETVDGTVIVNTLDPNKDTVKIALDIPIAEMMQRDHLYFDVYNEDKKNSQKSSLL